MGAAAAVELAALHREVDVAAGLVACDHLDPGRKQLVQHRRVELHLRTRADAPDRELLDQHVGPGLQRRSVPKRAHAFGTVEGAEPVELQGLKTRALAAPEWRERHCRFDEADSGAVLRRRCIKKIRRQQPPGTGMLYTITCGRPG